MITIRKARAEEAADLSALCMRSKAHWGYDDAFMKACEPAITITAIPIVIYDGVLVAEGPNGRPAGVAVIQPLPQPLTFDLTHFFIDPAFMRRGIGNTLFDAIVGLMAGKGGRILRIEADPFAAGFYEKLGARRIGDVPSESISGRMLPLFKYAIR